MSDYPMLISNKLHSFRNFLEQTSQNEREREVEYQSQGRTLSHFFRHGEYPFFLKNTFFCGCKITEFTGIVLLNPSN